MLISCNCNCNCTGFLKQIVPPVDCNLGWFKKSLNIQLPPPDYKESLCFTTCNMITVGLQRQEGALFMPSPFACWLWGWPGQFGCACLKHRLVQMATFCHRKIPSCADGYILVGFGSCPLIVSEWTSVTLTKQVICRQTTLSWLLLLF